MCVLTQAAGELFGGSHTSSATSRRKIFNIRWRRRETMRDAANHTLAYIAGNRMTSFASFAGDRDSTAWTTFILTACVMQEREPIIEGLNLYPPQCLFLYKKAALSSSESKVISTTLSLADTLPL